MNVFYENFGLQPLQVERNKIIYGEETENRRHIIMTVFRIFSGIDVVLYNSFDKYIRKPGEIRTSNQDFYCISYYFSGLFFKGRSAIIQEIFWSRYHCCYKLYE